MHSKLIYCFVRHGLGPLCHFNFMILWMDQPLTSKFQNWFMISSTMSLKKCRWDLPGWWFGTCFMTFHILECRHPNWLMFFRGVETNQWYPGIDSGGKNGRKPQLWLETAWLRVEFSRDQSCQSTYHSRAMELGICFLMSLRNALDLNICFSYFKMQKESKDLYLIALQKGRYFYRFCFKS